MEKSKEEGGERRERAERGDREWRRVGREREGDRMEKR